MDEESIFLEILACRTDDSRKRVLDERCGEDAFLKQRLLDLLRNYDNAGSFLGAPLTPWPLAVTPSVLGMLDKTVSGIPRITLRDTSSPPMERPVFPRRLTADPREKYQIHGEIARGGMGSIVKCRDRDLGRDLALKVLLEQNSADPEHTRRFVEEAGSGWRITDRGA